MNPSLLLLVAAWVPTTPSSGPEVFAVIVANNRSVGGALAPLRYADDDGARWFELLKLGARQARLLAVLDHDTQDLHPEAARKAQAPTRRALDDALEKTFSEIEAARRDGRETAFVFVYVGHGSLADDGGGELHLSDQRLGRQAFFERVIAASPATLNHVIVDACHALDLVAARGEEETAAIEAAIENYLDRESLDTYPNTGFLAATTGSNQVHEWSRFRAGVFSHELRSALAGAADVDGDGAVTYREIEAFVAAANARVVHAEARLHIVARPPPVYLGAALLAEGWAPSAPRVHLPSALAGRWWLEDDRGVRYLDFHTAAGLDLELTLVPRETYFLRNDTEEVPIPMAVATRVDASTLPRRPALLSGRGGTGSAFRDLFSVPFGPAWLAGFSAAQSSASMEHVQVSSWGPRESVALGLFLGSAAAIAGGVALALDADAIAQDYRSAAGSVAEVLAIRGRASDRATTANVLLGVAAAFGLAGALTLSW